MHTTDIRIDWPWVRDELMKKEHIRRGSAPHAVFEKHCRHARRLAVPTVISVEKKIACPGPGTVTVSPSVTLHGARLQAALRGASHACIFLVTIGDELENTASGYMKVGDSLEGYMLDRIGSFAVESLAENFEDRLRKIYGAKKRSVSMRVSPGYCDWPVEEQSKLAKLLDFSRAGVRLTESLMMVPKKSISGLVGIGPEGLFSKTGSRCGMCDNKECAYRSSS
jgi:hypothetical protein